MTILMWHWRAMTRKCGPTRPRARMDPTPTQRSVPRPPHTNHAANDSRRTKSLDSVERSVSESPMMPTARQMSQDSVSSATSLLLSSLGIRHIRLVVPRRVAPPSRDQERDVVRMVPAGNKRENGIQEQKEKIPSQQNTHTIKTNHFGIFSIFTKYNGPLV